MFCDKIIYSNDKRCTYVQRINPPQSNVPLSVSHQIICVDICMVCIVVIWFDRAIRYVNWPRRTWPKEITWSNWQSRVKRWDNFKHVCRSIQGVFTLTTVDFAPPHLQIRQTTLGKPQHSSPFKSVDYAEWCDDIWWFQFDTKHSKHTFLFKLMEMHWN